LANEEFAASPQIENSIKINIHIQTIDTAKRNRSAMAVGAALCVAVVISFGALSLDTVSRWYQTIGPRA
jgi:hypothetical protein